MIHGKYLVTVIFFGNEQLPCMASIIIKGQTISSWSINVAFLWEGYRGNSTHADSWIFGFNLMNGLWRDRDCSFGNDFYWVGIGLNWCDDNYLFKCEMFDGFSLRSWTGWYFKLHVDDWIFGSDLKHARNTDEECSFGKTVYHVTYGLRWKIMTPVSSSKYEAICFFGSRLVNI